ncbi:MAG: hypothetical protein AAFY02_12210 [Pseudomonadota bacterium]
MRALASLLCLVGVAACAPNVPIGTTLTDADVTSLAEDRSGSLEIIMEGGDLTLFATMEDCNGLSLLVLDGDITANINQVLDDRGYPAGLGRLREEYPEIVRVMQCETQPAGTFDDTDILTAERVVPGNHTVYQLLSLPSAGAGHCLIWRIPVVVQPDVKTTLSFSDDLLDGAASYSFSQRRCRL